jgi:hypothetical protein
MFRRFRVDLTMEGSRGMPSIPDKKLEGVTLLGRGR